MRRREFVTLVGGAVVSWSITSHAQQSDKTRLIGVLISYAESDRTARSEVASFRGGLAKLGWTEGSNLRIELRWGNADPDRIRTFANPAQGGKWVELLKEIAPRTLRMALLFNPVTAVPLQFLMPSIQAAASSLAIQISDAPVQAKDEIEGVIAAQARNPGGGLIAMPDSFNLVNREPIIALAARYRVPTIYFNRIFTESGGLITFGTDFVEQFRQVPEYIDRILKGEKPADLPIQAPTKFELVINLKTAKTLGLDVPTSMQLLADEVIE
jgi:hypothetical protein